MGFFNKTKKYCDLEHLEKDGSIPLGWYNANKEICEKIKSEYGYFLNEWIESRNKEPKKRYESLKSFILYMNDAKELCKSKNECFSKWFSDTIADDGYIATRQAELDEFIKNYDSINHEWKTRHAELPNLDKKIIDLLRQNNGIIQSDFVKMFDAAIQDDVKEKLYFMDKSGQIQRKKCGRSYIINLK